MSFVLEVKSWANFEYERSFDDFLGARRFADERYSQNAWRIIDLVANTVLHEHDPMEAIEVAASSESDRFRRFDHWMQNEHQRRRLVEVAMQQRRMQRRRPQAQTQERRSHIQALFQSRKNPVAERINWMVEGF